MEESFEEYRKRIMKVGRSGYTRKVRNSWGVKDAFRTLRKQKWPGIGFMVSEKDFYAIIRQVNNRLAKELTLGNTITLPHHMGRIELRKMKTGAIFKDGKLRVAYPVDWKKTMKLWYEDKEAEKEKILVRYEKEIVYTTAYMKTRARFNNKIFYEFEINRSIKQALGKNIDTGITDTLYQMKSSYD